MVFHYTAGGIQSPLTGLLAILAVNSILAVSASTGRTANAAEGIDSEVVGTPPPEDTDRTAIRDTEVSVGKRSLSLAIGFIYLNNSRIENLRKVRTRALTIPIDVSLGLTDELEFYFGTALEAGERQTILPGDADTTTDSTLADLSVGVSWQVAAETAAWPSITLNGSVSIPIGSDDQNEALDGNLGDGSGTLGASFTRRIDPLVLSANIAYSDSYSSGTVGDVKVRDGASVDYGFGTAFQINSAISISGRFQASYQFETEVDDIVFQGSNSEPMSLSTSLAYSPGPRRVWQYLLRQGLNDDGGGVRVGATYIITFDGR